MGDGVLIGAVVVHGPDLFVSAAHVDVIDLGFGDAGDATAEAEDDLVGEAVGDLAGGVVGGGLVVLLGEDLRVLGVFGVEEEALDGELAGLRGEAAEGDHGGGGGRAGPLREVDLAGGAGRGLRVHAFRDEIEDAGGGEVAVEGGVEELLERGDGGVGRGGLEVGDGEADAFGAGRGLGLEGVLRAGEGGRREREEDEEAEGEAANETSGWTGAKHAGPW